MQRFDAIGGLLVRRGTTLIPPGAKSAGKLHRAEFASGAVNPAGQLFRAQADALPNTAGQLYRAEVANPTQASVPTVPLSSFQRPGDTFEVALTRLTTDTVVDLEGTSQVCSDFDQGGNVYGLYYGSVIGYTNGSISMTPSTSTHAAAVNAQGSGTTVQETVIRLGRGTSKATTPYFGANLVGTSQGHIYNGVVIYYCTNAIVENCAFYGVPGSSSAPPGETTPLNNYQSVGTTVRNILMDGQLKTATGMLNSNCRDVLVQNSTFQRTGSGHGIAAYQTQNVTIENSNFLNIAKCGVGFEKCTGTLTISNCTFSGNEHDMVVDTDGASAIVNIYDPVWDGMNTGTKFKVLIHTRYAYPPVANPPLNGQKASDVHLFMNGVEVTSTRLQIVTN